MDNPEQLGKFKKIKINLTNIFESSFGNSPFISSNSNSPVISSNSNSPVEIAKIHPIIVSEPISNYSTPNYSTPNHSTPNHSTPNYQFKPKVPKHFTNNGITPKKLNFA